MTARPLSKEILENTLRNYFKNKQNQRATARSMQIPHSTVAARLEMIRNKYPDMIEEYLSGHKSAVVDEWLYPQFLTGEITNGCILVGGDAHIWPGVNTIMMQAFIKVAKQLKPHTIVLNGDIIDGARVSRHGAVLGSAAPKVSAEIDAAKAWMDKLPKCQRRIFTIGNHDMRVDTYLANQASELEDYAGRLADRFPLWEFCYAYQVNDEVEFRHRFRSGIHAAYNNAMVAGWTTVTNHTHAQQMTAVRNRRGSHWGIETGMLGDPSHKCFQYAEGAPSRAHEGFAVLTFDETGILMPPEFCQMLNGRPVFRGQYVL
jgi:hypothetical protein